MISAPITGDEFKRLVNTAKFIPTADMVGIMFVEGDEVCAAACLCNATETSVWIHMAIYNPKVLESNFMAEEVLGFTFGAAGRKIALTQTNSLNVASLELQKAYGFEEFARVRNGVSDGEDIVFMILTAEEYLRRIH